MTPGHVALNGYWHPGQMDGCLTRAQVIAAVYDEWAREQPPAEPVSAEEPEAALAMNAGPEADADLHRRVQAALQAAGMRPTW